MTVILLPYGLPELIDVYEKVKYTVHYNRCMYKHYKHLYDKNRRRWRFKSALFAWIKMISYEKKMYQAQVNELEFELNKTSHASIILSK